MAPADSAYIFDVRQSVHLRLIIRVAVLIGIGSTTIYYGTGLIPTNLGRPMSIGDTSDLNFWSIIGVLLIGIGIFNIAAAVTFLFRSRHAAGHWHFRLTADDLLWQIPRHGHGEETGFQTKLSDIKQLEFRTLRRDESVDKRSYWVHFKDGTPSIELKSYSGVSLSWMIEKIAAAGVAKIETQGEY